MASIRLSQKYGVNPAIPLWFYCNEPKNEIILAGAFGGKEAPRNAVWDRVPCDKCQEWMKQGILFISTKDGESGDNPYRTGGWCVIKEEAVKGFVTNPDVLNSILKARVAFIEDKTWDAIGLPRE
jgi:hypothetical protein